jgi:predicted metal-dependent HD superfamily phosphohydrolase
MYEYYYETKEPYSFALDIATAFHDSIYDANPDKEIRSAEWCRNMCSIYSIGKDIIDDACELIMATSDHVVYEEKVSAIVRADLHQLADLNLAKKNRTNIIQESKNLYGISTVNVIKANSKFLRGLQERLAHNRHLDKNHAEFYTKVIEGIEYTIELNNESLIRESL